MITDVTEEEAKQEEDVADLPPPLETVIPEATAAGAGEEKPAAPLLNRRE